MSASINGEMLRKVRSAKHVSQEILAEKSGVGIATIKRIERTQAYRCRSRTAERLASTLGIEISDLSEDNFTRIIDIGGDVELHLNDYMDIGEFRAASKRLEIVVEVRNALVARLKAPFKQ